MSDILLSAHSYMLPNKRVRAQVQKYTNKCMTVAACTHWETACTRRIFRPLLAYSGTHLPHFHMQLW